MKARLLTTTTRSLIVATVMLSLASALLLAVTTLIVKRLTETEHPEAIVAWMVILQTPLALVPALFVWGWPSAVTWMWLLCLSIEFKSIILIAIAV